MRPGPVLQVQTAPALPTALREPKFAALVGIDWGDKKHAWALQVEGSSQIERGEMPHTPEAIQEWVTELRRPFPTGCVAIALEQSRGPLVFALSKYEHLVLYPIHPTSAADYRKVFPPIGSQERWPRRSPASGHAGPASGQATPRRSAKVIHFCSFRVEPVT